MEKYVIPSFLFETHSFAEWLEILPVNTSSLFRKYMEECPYSSAVDLQIGEKRPYFQELLGKIFDWEATPEGSHYWYNLSSIIGVIFTRNLRTWESLGAEFSKEMIKEIEEAYADLGLFLASSYGRLSQFSTKAIENKTDCNAYIVII